MLKNLERSITFGYLWLGINILLVDFNKISSDLIKEVIFLAKDPREIPKVSQNLAIKYLDYLSYILRKEKNLSLKYIDKLNMIIVTILSEEKNENLLKTLKNYKNIRKLKEKEYKESIIKILARYLRLKYIQFLEM